MLSLANVAVLAILAADSLVAGPIETVAEEFRFTEGPVWTTSGELWFTDIPANTIYRADKSVVASPSGNANGLTLDPQGRVVRCEHGGRRVARMEADGSVTTLADRYDGKRFNSPNDAVIRNDGVVFFTDPTYGLAGREQEIDAKGVYVIRADGTVRMLADDFNMPNGIALSPDQKTLYVADTAGSHIRSFALAPDATVSGGDELCKVPTPDGIRVDEDGNIWATSGAGVMVFSATGDELETIKFPQIPANCTFGGPNGKTLYVTARTAVYSVRTNSKGLVGGWNH